MSTVRILFLDDDRTRWMQFQAQYPYATWVETAKACCDALRDNGPWDLVCLDHDLGGEHLVSTLKSNSGSGVVRWIVTRKPEVGAFIVHSANGPASLRMVEDLQRAGYQADYRLLFWMSGVSVIDSGEGAGAR